MKLTPILKIERFVSIDDATIVRGVTEDVVDGRTALEAKAVRVAGVERSWRRSIRRHDGAGKEAQREHAAQCRPSRTREQAVNGHWHLRTSMAWLVGRSKKA